MNVCVCENGVTVYVTKCLDERKTCEIHAFLFCSLCTRLRLHRPANV